MSNTSTTNGPRFCSDCGTALNPGARFCHACGASVSGGGPRASEPGAPRMLQWGLPIIAIIAVIAISLAQYGKRDPATAGEAPLGAMSAPDISTMTPEERADRLFNRVMRLSSEGKTDSAAFFGPMALGALEALPLDAHRRYDIGVVSLVMGDATIAKAQSDTILRARPNHLLGLALAARAADARRDAAGARTLRQRLLAAESAERAAGLPEYSDHAADITTAIDLARKK